MEAKQAPDCWKDSEVFLDLGGEEGFVDDECKPLPLQLTDVSDRGVVVEQKYGGVSAPTFYPWHAISKIVKNG